MVGEHQSADLVGGLYVGALLAKGNLDRGRTPFNQLGQFPLSDSLKGLVNLGGIDLALNDVQNRDVCSFPRCAADHDVLGLKEAAHDI